MVGAAGDDESGSDSGIAYLYVNALGREPIATPIATLRNPRPAAGDAFGSAVAISASGVLIGVPGDDLLATDAGDAYFYPLDGTSFDFPRRTLNDSGQPFGAGFGTSVAIARGGIFTVPAIVVGAPVRSRRRTRVWERLPLSCGKYVAIQVACGSPSPGVGDHYGAAVAIASFMADRTSGSVRHRRIRRATMWAPLYRYLYNTPRRPMPPSLVADPNGSANDHFGNAMAADGLTNVIAAFRAAGGGKVFVSTGNLVLNNPGAAGDDFGFSVALSGSRVIIGAPGEDSSASNAGSAYVYDTAAATPDVPAAILRNPDPAAGDGFGTAVAISGRYAVVGAPNDDTGCADAGSAYVFDLAGTSPTVPIAVLRNPAPKIGAKFGHAADIEGTIIAVGAPDDPAIVRDGGVVFLYDLASSTPSVPVATLRPPAPSDRHRFGYSLAIAGENLVVGAPWEGHNGAVHVFGPDTAGPTGGTVTLFAPEPVDAGAWTCVFFDDWKDPNGPLTYVVMIDGVAVNAPTTGTTIHFAVPTTPGVHRLTGCIFDARGNVTEVPRNFTVSGSVELAPKVFAAAGTSAGLVGEEGAEGYLRATIQRTGAVSFRLDYQGKVLRGLRQARRHRCADKIFRARRQDSAAGQAARGLGESVWNRYGGCDRWRRSLRRHAATFRFHRCESAAAGGEIHGPDRGGRRDFRRRTGAAGGLRLRGRGRRTHGPHRFRRQARGRCARCKGNVALAVRHLAALHPTLRRGWRDHGQCHLPRSSGPHGS